MEGPSLSIRVKVVIFVGIVASIALAITTVVIATRRYKERQRDLVRIRETRESLTGLANCFKGRRMPAGTRMADLSGRQLPPSRADAENEHELTMRLSQLTVVLYERESEIADLKGLPGSVFKMSLFLETRDVWGRVFVYRCPGPVHRHGWDFYSVGPDGIDDAGRGDDILIGEDLLSEE